MIFTPTPLPGCYEVQLTPRGDSRGWFSRFYCKEEFKAIGHSAEWVQMNHSFTEKKGTIRGMHFQLPPHGEIKMVRCISGAVFDVVVDIRKESPTFRKWFSTELSAENKKMLYIPTGFAHGFQTLADDTELIYFHSEYYQPGVEAGLRYSDPAFNIAWPAEPSVLSERDQQHQLTDQHFKGI